MDVFLKLEVVALGARAKPGSLSPSDEKERRNNFDPGVTERAASSPKDHVLASGRKLKMSLPIVRHRRDVVMGPGRIGNIFERNKSVQKDLDRDVKKFGGGHFFSLCLVIVAALRP